MVIKKVLWLHSDVRQNHLYGRFHVHLGKIKKIFFKEITIISQLSGYIFTVN